MEDMYEQELEQLRQFHKRADKLKQKYNKFMVGKLSHNITYHKDKGMKETVSGAPSEDDVEHFSNTLRPFILQKDPVNFLKIRKILAKYVPADRQDVLDQAKDKWKTLFSEENYSLGGGIGVEIQGQKLSTGIIIDRWFNGHIFHVNIEDGKTEELETWLNTAGGGLTYFQLVDLLQQLAYIIMVVDDECVVPVLQLYDIKDTYE